MVQLLSFALSFCRIHLVAIAAISTDDLLSIFMTFAVLVSTLSAFFYLERYIIAPWMWRFKSKVIAAQLTTVVILTAFLFGLEYWLVSTYEISPALMLLSLLLGLAIKVLAYILYGLERYYQYQKDYPQLLDQSKLTSAHERVVKQRLEHFKDTFSPHLMFNILNEVQNQLPRDSSAYEALDILHQVLYYEFNTPAEKEVLLSQELSHINNYLSLHHIKDPNLCVRIYKNGDFSQTKILPRVLLNYIDNAIKHGVRNDPDRPITIKINVNEHAFSLEVFNYKNNHTMPGTRYGNTITATALRTFYDTRQQLSTNSLQDTYQVNLKLLHEPPLAHPAPPAAQSISDFNLTS